MKKITYKDIQNWVKNTYGFVPKSCWIAHCKELYGLAVRNAPNRPSENRIVPCPKEKQDAIKEAFLYFKMLKK